MPNIKIGDNTLTGVSELQCVNADDTTQHVIFYSAPRAILAVTAPAGSTIDVLQNSIVLQTYTLGAAETSHSFKVDVSTTNYVVRASLGVGITSREVYVSAPIEYNITLNFKLYLYNSGDECTEITGGWEKKGYIRNNTSSFTKDNLYLSYNATSLCSTTSIATKNSIDVTNYSSLHVHFQTCTSSSWNDEWACIAFTSSSSATSTTLSPFQGSAYKMVVKPSGNLTNVTVTGDISSITQPIYIYLVRDAWGSCTSNRIIPAVWIE